MRSIFALVDGANLAAKAITGSKVFSEASQKRPGFRELVSTVHDERVLVNDQLADRTIVSANRAEVEQFVERIVRGLVFHFHPKIHNHLSRVWVELIDGMFLSSDRETGARRQFVRRMVSRLQLSFHTICHQVCEFGSQVFPGEGIVFVLTFYRGITFFASVEFPGIAASQKQPAEDPRDHAQGSAGSTA